VGFLDRILNPNAMKTQRSIKFARFDSDLQSKKVTHGMRKQVLFLFIIIFSLANQSLAQEKDPIQNPLPCSYANGQAEILSDTICERNGFIVETEHSLINPDSSGVQCNMYGVYFYLVDTIGGSPIFELIDSFYLGNQQIPAPFVGTYAFDITSSLSDLLVNSLGKQLTCGEHYTIHYSVGHRLDPNITLYQNDTVSDQIDIYYKCFETLQVTVFPTDIPIVTCGETITLSTNFSSNPDYLHTWYAGAPAPNGTLISNNSTVDVNMGQWYYVYVENQNTLCDSGRGQT
jgi:hypothetical protein